VTGPAKIDFNPSPKCLIIKIILSNFIVDFTGRGMRMKLEGKSIQNMKKILFKIMGLALVATALFCLSGCSRSSPI
jgi:hypothetical protein